MPITPAVVRISLLLLASVAAVPAAAADAGEVAGDDFIGDARLLYRVAACGREEPAAPAAPAASPEALAPDAAEQHCKAMRALVAGWRRRWIDKAVPFLAAIVPGDLPPELVYPFGGGDLFTALATFPRAAVITTLSLEPSGNPTTFAAAAPDVAEHALAVFRDHVRRLSFATHSKTTNLLEFRHEVLPDQLAFALLALVAFDCEPVRLRYFELGNDGAIHYLTKEMITARKTRQFANMELAFRRRGDAAAPVRVHRHLQANLADQPLARTPAVMAHLVGKGRVTAMTKAASYLLWSPSFTQIRDYLLEHAEWMISDSTGIPVRFAARAGFEQQTWGQFTGAFLAAAPEHQQDFVSLWAGQPARPLPFGFGYPDKENHDHLLVTRRRTAGP